MHCRNYRLSVLLRLICVCVYSSQQFAKSSRQRRKDKEIFISFVVDEKGKKLTMSDVTQALRELTDSNRQLLARINALEEQRDVRKKQLAEAYLEMDIKFVMEFRKWDREKALERLQQNNYDVGKVIQTSSDKSLKSDRYLENVLAHYEYKRNREIIERW